MRRRVLAAAVAVPLATACFSDAPPPAAPEPPKPPTTASVEAGASANTFTPQTTTIAKGGTVTWTFSTRPHNVTFVAATGAPTNVPTTTNNQAARTFTETGTFAYACTLHAGMIGTVVVK